MGNVFHSLNSDQVSWGGAFRAKNCQIMREYPGPYIWERVEKHLCEGGLS